MKDLLIMAVFGLFCYVFYKIMLKEPILPWKEKTEVANVPLPNKKGKKKKHHSSNEPKLFEELFNEIQNIENHMIRFKDNTFTLIAEVEPVNYFLKSQDEQEQIDVVFESWLASINYSVGWYLQNRYIDISDPIKSMQKSMREAQDLNETALDYGENMIQDLLNWQRSAPRYETKRYLIFSYKINPNDINADSKEELEEKIIDKAFAELMRRFHAAKNQLRKAEIEVKLLPTEGIYELLYYTFNRRRAVKLRFRDVVEQEMNSIYVTADQSNERIEMVKEAIQANEEEQDRENEKVQKEAS